MNYHFLYISSKKEYFFTKKRKKMSKIAIAGSKIFLTGKLPALTAAPGDIGPLFAHRRNSVLISFLYRGYKNDIRTE